jgi:hypothetical protein
LDSYFGGSFEKLCQESLAAAYQRQHVLWEHIGQYWDAKVQIDVVGVRKDNWIDLGECKWGEMGSLGGVAKELDRKAALYPAKSHVSIGRHLFLRNKPRTQIDGTQIHHLSDLFNGG